MKEHIFKAYDIRGIYGSELTDEVAYFIGIAYAKHLMKLGLDKVIIGYDNRFSSIPLSENIIRGITDMGVNIINLGLVTTPMVYYARVYLKVFSAIVITASHSPSEYNGLKFSFDESGFAYGEIIEAFKEEVKSVMSDFNKSNVVGKVANYDLRSAYLEMLDNKIVLGDRKVKVVVDCGNGTGSIVAVEAFERVGCEVIPLYCESDGSFPNHHPDPAVEANMKDLKHRVIEEKADLGVSVDGDADRIGVVDELGNMIYADYLIGILGRDIFRRTSDKRLLVDIKCSKAIEDDVVKNGGEVTYVRSGHSYGKKALNEGKYLLGGELSGHIYIADDFFGYDDGLYAGLRLVKILSNTDEPFSSLLNGFNKYYATPESFYKVDDSIKFKIIDEMKKYAQAKRYEILTVDGVKVLFDDGWALVRASNTGPNITMRFEAANESRLMSLKEEFEGVYNMVMKSIK